MKAQAKCNIYVLKGVSNVRHVCLTFKGERSTDTGQVEEHAKDVILVTFYQILSNPKVTRFAGTEYIHSVMGQGL